MPSNWLKKEKNIVPMWKLLNKEVDLGHRDAPSSSRASSSVPRGIGQVQCLYSLPERPKLRDLPDNQNHKGPVQKTHWYSRAKAENLVI